MDEPERDETVNQRRIGVREFRGNMADVLRRVANGSSFLITSHGKVLAEVRPPASSGQPRRQAGTMRGEVWMAPDFDALPIDVLASMEGEGE